MPVGGAGGSGRIVRELGEIASDMKSGKVSSEEDYSSGLESARESHERKPFLPGGKLLNTIHPLIAEIKLGES